MAQTHGRLDLVAFLPTGTARPININVTLRQQCPIVEREEVLRRIVVSD